MAYEGLNIEEQFPNNPNVMSEIDAATLSQTVPVGYVQATPDPYSQQIVDAYNAQFTPQETGMLGPNALYPGAGHNINVGTYGGSRIGSNPIFVPGGNIMAIDPVLARRKALDDAARLKASSIKPFTYQKPYQLKDARFQQSLTDQTERFATEMIRDAQSKYGKDFGVVLSDQSTPEGRSFIQGMANFETLGRNFDQITDLMAGIEQGLQDKTKVYSPETLKQYQNFKTLVGDFANGDVNNSVDLAQQYDKLKGMRSFEDYIQSDGFLKDFQGRINQSFYVNEAGDYFRTGTTKKVEFGDAINEVVESLAERDFAPEIQAGLYDKDYLKRAIRARLKDQKISEGSIQQKTDATRNAETIEVFADLNTINKHNADTPGSAQLFSYNQDGSRGRAFQVPLLADWQFKLSSNRSVNINERDPNTGKVQTTNMKGAIGLNSVKILKPGENGTFTYSEVPGVSYVDLSNSEISKLKDGTIVAKARHAVPTTQIVKGDKPKGQTDSKMDSYTLEDTYIVLQDSKGNRSGAYTEILSNVQSEEGRDKFKEGYNEVKNWSGTNSSGGNTYEYQGEKWSYDELKGAGWTDDQIRSLKKG